MKNVRVIAAHEELPTRISPVVLYLVERPDGVFKPLGLLTRPRLRAVAALIASGEYRKAGERKLVKVPAGR
jgi:hypothetical protein